MKQEILILKAKQDTINLAKQLAKECEKGDIIALRGMLGAGKTFFANAFINAIYEKEGRGKVKVTSPTFNLIKIYETDNFPIYHYDLYRLKKVEELYELGIEDSLEEGVVLIEWPELAEKMLGGIKFDLEFENLNGEEERAVKIIFRN
jgi:tRNA threonylcarbamoyl adenosine modification protein YjeE